MAKLTKAEAKAHTAACALLEKDRLTEDDKEFVYRNWNEGANHVNGSAGAFFTPFDMAFDVAIDIYGAHIIDLCAGIGVLSYAAYCRSQWDEKRARITCIECNPDYVAVGKKLLPEATWICADVFDVLDMGLGRFEGVVSNPPFGSVARNGRAGPRYTGATFEFHVIDIASQLADYGTFIVPQQSAGFKYSGARCYQRDTEGKAVEFQSLTGLHFDTGAGVDTEFYRKEWKGVSPLCEIVCVDFTSMPEAANDNVPVHAEQDDLFWEGRMIAANDNSAPANAGARAYYNEIDPYAAQWLRNLIAAGHITPGDVDERSIIDVKPTDLAGYTQCHFFAGIGVWSYGLRSAGIPDSANVWTGSCPCQPFSAAGKGGGFDDERHLWPAFHHLINECKPSLVLGEQVASKDGLAWLDLVQSDLEGTGYANAAIDMCSAGFGAPHIRQRLYWMAYATDAGQQRWWTSETGDERNAPWLEPQRFCNVVQLGDSIGTRLEGHGGDVDERHKPGRVGEIESGHVASASCAGSLANTDDTERRTGTTGRDDNRGADSGRSQSAGDVEGRGCGSGVANTDGGHTSAEGLQRGGQHGQRQEDAVSRNQHRRPGSTNGFWRDADWLLCRDGKWRPVEPGTFPLAHGATSRMGRLRAYGNAINAEQAAEFCRVALAAAANDNNHGLANVA